MAYDFSPNNRALSLSWIWCPLAPCKKSEKSNTNTWTDRCTWVHRNSLKRVNVPSVLNTAVYLKLDCKVDCYLFSILKFLLSIWLKRNLKKTFMTPFYGWCLIFTTKFPEIPGTHFIDLGKMKGWVDLGATQWLWTRDPGLGIQRLSHWVIVP